MKIKFDINYLYIIGTIFVIAIFISLFAVTVSSTGASIAEVPTITFAPEVSGPPPSVGLIQSSIQTQPPMVVITEPPKMMATMPPSTMGPTVQMQPSTMAPSTMAPSTMMPSMPEKPSRPMETGRPGRAPAMQNLPTRVNPMLTKPSRNTPPSDVILVENNSGMTGGPAKSSQGSAGLTQGLIQ